jgi:hypothetical protein
MATFSEKFNEKYREKVERTRLDYEKKNQKFTVYKNKLDELYAAVGEAVKGTPIKAEFADVQLEKRENFLSSTREPLKKLTLRLEDCFISFTPEGIDYQTGSARLRVDHNNERERPLSIEVFLRKLPDSGEEQGADFNWQIRIGYRNFKPFDKMLIEGLIETVFLS